HDRVALMKTSDLRMQLLSKQQFRLDVDQRRLVFTSLPCVPRETHRVAIRPLRRSTTDTIVFHNHPFPSSRRLMKCAACPPVKSSGHTLPLYNRLKSFI